MTASDQRLEEWYEEGQKKLDEDGDIRGLSLISSDRDQVTTVVITRLHCTVCCAFRRVFAVLLAALEVDIWGSKLAGSAQHINTQGTNKAWHPRGISVKPLSSSVLLKVGTAFRNRNITMAPLAALSAAQ